MTRGAEGVLALNALFLLTGLAILFALRGWRTWLDFAAHLAVAYVLGLASVCVLATLVLVAGGGLSYPTIAAMCVVPTVALAEVGFWRRRPLPRGPGRLPRPTVATVAGGLVALVTVGLLVQLYRVSRVEPMTGWDAWAFWVPKAKAIYFFGGIDNDVFPAFVGGSYPLLVPALDAMDFRFMGGTADTAALSLQYLLFFAGFLGAAATLLRPFVRAWLVWLFVGLAITIPDLHDRLFMGLADWPLDFLWVLSALFLVRWLRTRESWFLAGCGIALAATMATKREGQLLVACLIAATLVATVRHPRRTWPPVLGVAALAWAVNIPWRIWWTSHHMLSETPGIAVGGITSNWSRVWPSARLVLDLQFETRFWLWLVPIALAAAVVGLGVAGIVRETAVLYLLTTVFCWLGFTWILVSQPGIELTTRGSDTPIPRAVGSVVLLSCALAPLLLEPLLAQLSPNSSLAQSGQKNASSGGSPSSTSSILHPRQPTAPGGLGVPHSAQQSGSADSNR